MSKEAEQASTSTSLGDDDVKNQFKHHGSKLNVQFQENSGGNYICQKKKRKIDELDDLWKDADNIMSNVGGGGSVPGSGSGGGRGGGDRGEKAPRSCGRASVSSKPAGAAGVKSPGKSQLTKSMRDLATSEQANLSAKQLLRKAETEDGYAELTEKVVNAMSEKVKSRLTSDLVAMYSAGFDASTSGGSSTPGLVCLEELRNHESSLKELVEVVSVGHQYKAAEATQCDDVVSCIGVLNRAKGKLNLKTMAISLNWFTLYLNKLVDLEQFATLARALSVLEGASESGSLEIDSPANLNLGLMPVADRVPFSERFLVQMIAGILRAADKLKILGLVFQTLEMERKFMAVGNTEGLLDEFKDLRVLASCVGTGGTGPATTEVRGLVLRKLDS